MTLSATIQALLDEQGIEYRIRTHPRTFSSRDLAQTTHVPPDHIAKSVILGDPAGLVMVVIPASSWVRLHAVQQELNRPLEIAPENEIDGLFPDCQPGAIPPMGFARGLETLVDEALTSLGYVYFEAGDHEHLVQVRGEDFRRLLAGCRHGRYSRPD